MGKKRIFPSANDIGLADGLPGRIGTEFLFRTLISNRGIGLKQSFVVTGLNVIQNAPPDLNVRVNPGTAIINGWMVDHVDTTQLVLLQGSSTNKVFCQVTTDGAGLANGVNFNSTTGNIPANSVFLAECITDGMSVLEPIQDKREITPIPQVGSYVGDGGTARFINVGFTPTLAVVASRETGTGQRIFGISGIGSGSNRVGLSYDQTTVRASVDNHFRPELTTLGFFVSGTGGPVISLNDTIDTYDWMAIP